MTARNRRGNGKGSIFFHAGRHLWCAVVSAEGRRKYLYGKTRAEVAQKLRAATEARESGAIVTAPQQSLATYLQQWLRDSVQPRVRPWTYKGYEVLVRVHITPAVGRVPLQKLTPQHVQRFVNQMVATGASAKTARYALGVLRTALNEALRWGLVGRNVAAMVPRPRPEPHEIQPLTASEARRLLEAANEDRLGALYSVALTMGLRQGEALGLRWQDVDLERGLVHVRFQLQWIDGRGLQLVPPKTRLSRRTLAMPPSMVANLRSHRTRQLEERLFAGSDWKERAGL